MPSPRCRGLSVAPRTTMLPRRFWVRVAGAVALLGAFLDWGAASRGAGPPAGTGPSAQWREYRRTVQPFFARHCFACHTDKKRGDVRLDLFHDEKALARGLPTIEK